MEGGMEGGICFFLVFLNFDYTFLQSKERDRQMQMQTDITKREITS